MLGGTLITMVYQEVFVLLSADAFPLICALASVKAAERAVKVYSLQLGCGANAWTARTP